MTYKIGGSALRKRRAFADEFGFPLLIAVRFLRFSENALWIIVEDGDRSRTSIDVTVADLTEGVRHVLWDDYMVMVLPSIFFRAIYDKSSTQGFNGVRHANYGVLREFHIVSEPDRPIHGPDVVDNAARYVDNAAIALFAFFEGFHPEQVAVHTEGTTTTQVLRPTLSCSVTDLVYTFNRLTRDDEGNVVLNPSRILAGSDSDSGLASREFIERVASDFWKSVLVILTFGHEDDQLTKWERLGGS